MDNSRYLNGAAILENFVPMPQGGIIARPGTRFVHEIKNSNIKTRLISFKFSSSITESYVLEFGDLYIRFYQNNGIITEADVAISGASVADPVVITTASAHGYSSGDHVIITGVVGMTELNGLTFSISVVNSTTFSLAGINGLAFTAYSSGGVVNKIYEIVSPYLEADLFGIQIAQSADVMYLTHRSYGPRKLARTGHTNWSLTTPSITDGSGAIFNTVDNYPAAVGFYEQRLMMGGTNNQPGTIFGSQSDDYENYDLGTGAANEGLEYTIVADEVNPIGWFSPGKVFVIGTLGGEFVMRANDFNDAITPTNIKIIRETNHGSASLRPLRIGGAVIFLQRVKKRLMEFLYNFEIDGYQASDITILSEHILREKVSDLTYQQEENRLVWLSREDGQAATLTYQREQSVFAWARHIFGGTNVVIETVAVVPGVESDQLWMIIKRTINGGTVRYTEYLTDFFYETDDVGIEDSIQMDSSLTYDGVEATAISGLEHLEGESVAVISDGRVVDGLVVASGAITLPDGGSKVTVGLGYTPKMRSLNFEPGNFRGTSQGKVGRVKGGQIRFFQTLGGFVGHEDGDFEEIVFNEDGDTMDTSPGLFTEDKPFSLDAGHNRKSYIEYQQRQPLPCTILSLMPEYEIYDK